MLSQPTLLKQTEVDLEETIRILSIASTLYAHAISSHQMIQQEKERLKELKLYYKMEWDAKVHNFGDIIGDSPKMNQVFQVIERIAESNVTILVRGETGTGKELVVAATNRDLEQMVKDGEFREDLYYRLNVIPIDLPPLRERGNDIKLLVNFFLERSIKNHKKRVLITDEAMDTLMSYPWPGNVRELENTIERIVLMGDENGISASDMQLLLPAFNNSLSTQDSDSLNSMENLTLEELEKEAIVQALERSDGNNAKAAELLGISVRQIKYKVEKYNV